MSPDLSLLGGSEIRHTNCAINVILQLWNMIDFRICDIPLFEVLLSICLTIYNFSREILVLPPSVKNFITAQIFFDRKLHYFPGGSQFHNLLLITNLFHLKQFSSVILSTHNYISSTRVSTDNFTSIYKNITTKLK